MHRKWIIFAAMLVTGVVFGCPGRTRLCSDPANGGPRTVEPRTARYRGDWTELPLSTPTLFPRIIKRRAACRGYERTLV
jgi:hypothetical protein